MRRWAGEAKELLGTEGIIQDAVLWHSSLAWFLIWSFWSLVESLVWSLGWSLGWSLIVSLVESLVLVGW